MNSPARWSQLVLSRITQTAISHWYL